MCGKVTVTDHRGRTVKTKAGFTSGHSDRMDPIDWSMVPFAFYRFPMSYENR